MKRQKKQRFVEGAIVRVPYGDGRHTYAQLIEDPWIRVFDHSSTGEVEDLESIISKPVLFTVAVHTFGITEGRWPILGQAQLRPEDRRLPNQFIQDLFNPSKLRILSNRPDGPQTERPATVAECEGLEAASVWDPEHVERRIADHYAGRTNLSLLVMRLVRPGEVFTVLLDRGQDASGNWVVSGRVHAPIRVGDRVFVGQLQGPLLTVAALKTYMDDADVPPLVSGESGTLHLAGQLPPEARSERVLYRAEPA